MTKKTSPAYRASKEETIPINKLHPFSNHPFHIRHDLEFSELVDSISESGIITPIVNIVVNTIVAARFIELYVYNAMASLSIATLCYQELHGIAVNFLKSYLAVALQGAVLYLVIGFYPALAGSLGTGGSITEQAWAMLGQSVILLVAVFMSGKFTKAITNAMT